MNKKNGLSRYRQEKIMRLFGVDVTATQTALMMDQPSHHNGIESF